MDRPELSGYHVEEEIQRLKKGLQSGYIMRHTLAWKPQLSLSKDQQCTHIVKNIEKCTFSRSGRRSLVSSRGLKVHMGETELESPPHFAPKCGGRSEAHRQPSTELFRACHMAQQGGISP